MIYAENNFYRNFIDSGKKFVISLHYNGDNSYLFVNGRQELKFKAKAGQLVKEQLSIKRHGKCLFYDNRY